MADPSTWSLEACLALIQGGNFPASAGRAWTDRTGSGWRKGAAGNTEQPGPAAPVPPGDPGEGHSLTCLRPGSQLSQDMEQCLPRIGAGSSLGAHPGVLPKAPRTRGPALWAPVHRAGHRSLCGQASTLRLPGQTWPRSQPVSPWAPPAATAGAPSLPRPLRPGPHANATHSWFHCPHGTDRGPGSLTCPRSHTGKK